MNSENKFRTYMAGHCHILSDKIVFTKTEQLDNPLDISYPNFFNFYKAYLIVFSIVLFYFGVEDIQKDKLLVGVINIVCALVFFSSSLYLFWHSKKRIIPRDKIIKIELNKATKYWTSAGITISFKDKRGNTRKRNSRVGEIDIARSVLQRNGLI